MGKQKHKMIVAGPLVYEAIYPMPLPRDPSAVRRGKQELTKPAQERLNLKNQWQKLECLMAANFRRGDLVLTLTFTDEWLPESRTEAIRRFKMFVSLLRERRAPFMKPTYYLYNVEHRHYKEKPVYTPIEKAKQGRWHFHVLLNSTGADYEDIKACWQYGLFDVKPFRVDRERNYETLARYWTKEAVDKNGQRRYSGSRGLKRPEIDTQIIDSRKALEPPKGSEVYGNTGEVSTLYGKYQVVKYVYPRLIEDAPKVRKRKKKHR